MPGFCKFIGLPTTLNELKGGNGFLHFHLLSSYLNKINIIKKTLIISMIFSFFEYISSFDPN